MTARRKALAFECAGATLVGVAHVPEKPAAVGVVIVVGGPQYRVGSHRQFVQLADEIAGAGYATLRFDYRGMGDSGGDYRGFEGVDEDIGAAVRALRSLVPTVSRVVLWGLCDGATAAAFHAARGGEVAGLALANPWVRTDAGLARSYVQHYYGRRLLQADFWRRLLSGRMPVGRRVAEFLGDWSRARRGGEAARAGGGDRALPERLRLALEQFAGPVLLLLSGADLTAREFDDCFRGRPWTTLRLRPALTRIDFPDADHTFTVTPVRQAVASATENWLRQVR